MDVCDVPEELLQWDRNLSEASEPGEPEHIHYSTHFTDLLDELSAEALLGQLLSDPFLTGRCDLLDGDPELPSPPPHIQSEHSYSLSGGSHPPSPLSHTQPEADDDEEEDEGWMMEVEEQGVAAELSDSPGLISALSLTLSSKPMTTDPPTDTPPQQIKLEPHEVDQFLNLSPKEPELLQLPPTPPSSHGSDSEGSHSPVYPDAPASPSPHPEPPSEPTNPLSDSPLLTAPHKLQGSGPLLLTEEERRTLIAEGYPVPTKLPLSKSEEKALKKIRRKIKNKISAQESRRKKKEYMDALERKVKTCSTENTELRKKVETLENTNKSLLLQLHSLQSIVTGKVPRSCKITSTQTSTCLMVVVLCFALFLGHFYQNIDPCSSNTETHLSERHVLQTYTSTVKSRSLLAVESDGADEEPRPYGLGGAYPEWDVQSNVMWRREQRGESLEESTHSASQPPVSLQNSTEVQRPHLSELHTAGPLQQPLAPRPKVIDFEGTVNKKS